MKFDPDENADWTDPTSGKIYTPGGTAELRPAYVWYCDECGEELYLQASVEQIPIEDVDPEDIEAIREQYGDEAVEGVRTVSYHTCPGFVGCHRCLKYYKTEVADL